MLEIVVLSSIGGVFIGTLFCYMWLKWSAKNRFSYLEMEAKARAKVIEQESKLLLQSAKMEIKSNKIAQEEAFLEKVSDIEKRQKALIIEKKSLEKEQEEITRLKNNLLNQENELTDCIDKNNSLMDKTIKKMENIASFTKEEAKSYILEKVEQRSRADIANIVRKYETIAKNEGEKKANYILSQATTRYAGEFAGERLVNLITLPTNEHKGRIIGKEGRNIKALEMLLGVDIVIDETPNTILVSSFNLYRRAIATEVIKILVEDGRIHPGRIEEIHAKVLEDFEQKTYEEGENIVIDLGIFPIHEELIMLLGRMKYRASYGQNALAHTLEVAKLARVMAAEMGGDEKLALRAGLLHDIGKALTQDLGGSHVDIGVDLCKKHGEHPSVINAILAHHGHAEPDSVESAAVCAADKLSAARPGARREVLESFTKRVTEIENIAKTKTSVKQAYAINAGREIRVFVNAHKITDSESVLLAKEIASEIEAKVQYPGEIKVSVIRELRATTYAK